MAKDLLHPKKITLGVWIDQWIKIYKQPKLKPASIKHLHSVLVPVKKSKLSGMEIGKIKAIDLEKMLNSIDSDSVRVRTYISLHECLDALVKNRTIKENVCDFVDRPNNSIVKQKNVPSSKEMDEILMRMKDVSPRYYLFSKFLVSTGLRRGEALALTWDDVDFDKGWIHVNKAFDMSIKKVSSTKTVTSNRRIPLLTPASEVLKSLNRENNEVFHFIGKQSCTRNFRHVMSKMGYSGISLHSLRHVFTTRCLESGVDKKVIQKWLGHAKFDMTVNVYSHVLDDFEMSQITKINIL